MTSTPVSTQAARVGKAHRVVSPPQVREVLGVHEGDSVLFRIQDGTGQVQSMRAFTNALQAKYAGRLTGALDKLIAERRAAVLTNDQPWAALQAPHTVEVRR